MKKYNVTVNGVAYEVEIEEAGEVASTVSAAPAPRASAPAPKAPAAAASVPAGGEPVKAPMPGSVVKVNVSVGADVKRGDVLCLLEAMKMENEICAPRDGKVSAVPASAGAQVQTGDVLVVLA